MYNSVIYFKNKQPNFIIAHLKHFILYTIMQFLIIQRKEKQITMKK